MANESKKMTATAQIKSLGIGESCSFPIERMSSIKYMASYNGLVWGKIFSTAINRAEKIITVTRKS